MRGCTLEVHRCSSAEDESGASLPQCTQLNEVAHTVCLLARSQCHKNQQKSPLRPTPPTTKPPRCVRPIWVCFPWSSLHSGSLALSCQLGQRCSALPLAMRTRLWSFQGSQPATPQPFLFADTSKHWATTSADGRKAAILGLVQACWRQPNAW